MTLLDTPTGPDGPIDYTRDRWGRPIIQGVAHTRTSAAAKPITDTYNLELWARRNMVYGMAKDPSLVARTLAIGGTPHEWDQPTKQQVNKICEAAATIAQASRSADIGTAVHHMIEQVNHGHDIDGGPYQDDLDAYQQTIRAAGWTINPDHCETKLVCPELLLAGTCDMIIEVAGRHHVADLKTGGTVEYSALDYAAQLAGYANSKRYDPVTDQFLPTPNIDTTIGYIVHLPAGQATCTIYEVDLIAGYEAVVVANRVREMRRQSRKWLTAAELQHPLFLGDIRNMWANPDEGPDITDDNYQTSKDAYMSLNAGQKAWINTIAAQAQQAGVSIHMRERPTVRRWNIMRGLVALAGDNADDNDLRCIAATIHGNDLPHRTDITAGWAVGAFTASQATQFADLINPTNNQEYTP
jgi:cytochrome c5